MTTYEMYINAWVAYHGGTVVSPNGNIDGQLAVAVAIKSAKNGTLLSEKELEHEISLLKGTFKYEVKPIVELEG